MMNSKLPLRVLGKVVWFLFGLIEMGTRFLFKWIYRSKGAAMPPIKNLVLLESATSIAKKIRTRKLTSVEVMKAFVARIEAVNPTLNCVVSDRFEDAMKEAAAADELIRAATMDEETLAKEKPFLGVPFTTKDCIAVKGMMQSSGLYKRRHVIAEEDADTIGLLRKAGAIPIGLTNISELCMWWESNNTVHGRTRNPYDSNHIVGGSSGGEGCAQAASASAFGIGSDIGGSIRMPAFFNGVFGHKPSKFVVSNKGQYPRPVTKEQDSFLGIGPLCRRADDLLPLLRIIAGTNEKLLRLDEPVDIKKIRFFYQDSDTGSLLVSPVSKEIRVLFEKIALHLDKAHKIKAERIQEKKFRKSFQMWLYNMKTPSMMFQQQLANLRGSINIPWEFLKWCVGYSEHTFIALTTALAEKIGPGYGSSVYEKFVEERDVFRREMMELLGDDGVLLYPTHPTAAPHHNEPLFKPFNFSYTGIVNVLTLPATHVPMGLDSQGLPIGIQVIANDKCDRLSIAVARELEKAFGGWTPPPIDA
ncbi:fatty-acid amide hydrolase 2 isoform X1 [Atheta coriaria]|uniref:fatty-acid amide hydrolase 2 isoform X1 n=2 Tax=Dalotia coriaria TaxID=877792 RepID=UPI0031F3BC6F